MAFDGYHKWLGIPPGEQPPNHYRLLGIALFESDQDVIDASANRQMAYVQSCATGENSALSQRILNELSVARICLLDANKKASYDAALKAKNAVDVPIQSAATVIRPRGESQPAGFRAPQTRAPTIQPPHQQSVRYQRRSAASLRARLTLALVVVLGGVLGVYVGITILGYANKKAVDDDPAIDPVVNKNDVAKLSKSTTKPTATNTQPTPLISVPKLQRPVPLPTPVIVQPIPVVAPPAIAAVTPVPVSTLAAAITPELAVAPFDATTARKHQEAWAKHLNTASETTNSIGAKLALIPPGEFLMGSPDGEAGRQANETQHRVKIPKPFYMGSTEVTQGQWKAVMGTEPWKGAKVSWNAAWGPEPPWANANGGVRTGADYPATYVSWQEAVEFCEKLSAKEGKKYGLPTEAQWEFACRAGTITPYSFGDDVLQLSDYAWFDKNTMAVREEFAHQVGLKRPNPWGLYDLHGNAFEWCSDWFGDYDVLQAEDPSGSASGSDHVDRGGSWFNSASNGRSAFRGMNVPSFRYFDLGFRCAQAFTAPVETASVAPPAAPLAVESAITRSVASTTVTPAVQMDEFDWLSPPKVVLEFASPDAGCLAISPDGRFIATGSNGTQNVANLNVRDVRTGQVVANATETTSPIGALAFTADGRRLIVGTTGSSQNVKDRLYVWDVASRSITGKLDGHSHHVTAIHALQDGHTALTASLDGTVRVWDLRDYRTLRTIGGSLGQVWSMDVSKDGKTVYAGCRGSNLWLCDVADGKTLHQFQGTRTTFNSTVVSTDGVWLAGKSTLRDEATDNGIFLWNLTNKELIQRLDLGEGIVATFLPDNRTLLAWTSEGLQLIDAPTGKVLHTHKYPVGPNAVVDVSNGLVANIELGRVRVYEFPKAVRALAVQSPAVGAGQVPGPQAAPKPAFLGPAALAGRGMKEELLTEKGGSNLTERSVEAGLLWLANHQLSNGLWSMTGAAQGGKGKFSKGADFENQEAATGMALLAYLGAGHTIANNGPYANVVKKGVDALIRGQDNTGKLFHGAQKDDLLYTQAICTMALCECLALDPAYPQLRARCQKAVDFCVAAQSESGGWKYTPRLDSDTSVTGWMLMALQSAKTVKMKVPEEAFGMISTYLDAVADGPSVNGRQVVHGSRYGYMIGDNFDHVMTAEGLLSRMYLGWNPSDERLRAGCDYLLKEKPPEWPERDMYYWYHATQLMFHMEGQYWKTWNSKYRDMLVNNQEKGGIENGSWNPMGTGKDEEVGADTWSLVKRGGRLYVTCLSIYMLEAYYRHLPLYSDLKKQLEARK